MTTAEIETVAPEKDQNFRKSPLYLLLKRTFPQYLTETMIIDVHPFADALGVSHELVYRWFRSGKIKPEYAKKLIELSKGKLTQKDFLDFVFA